MSDGDDEWTQNSALNDADVGSPTGGNEGGRRSSVGPSDVISTCRVD